MLKLIISLLDTNNKVEMQFSIVYQRISEEHSIVIVKMAMVNRPNLLEIQFVLNVHLHGIPYMSLQCSSVVVSSFNIMVFLAPAIL